MPKDLFILLPFEDAGNGVSQTFLGMPSRLNNGAKEAMSRRR